MLNDTHPNLAIMKSRQLGLSEIGVLKLIHFLDTHSYDSVKAAYAFPTYSAVTSFVKTRLDPALSKGYYNTILDEGTNSQEVKKLRNSFVFFRTSSKPGAFEGRHLCPLGW